jgi:hypothetical protein
VRDTSTISQLAWTLDLGSLLAEVNCRFGTHDLLAH